MATATASVYANQTPPRLRLVQPRLDLDSLSAEWQVALDAAERAIAAATPLLKSQEVAVRREWLRVERLAVAAELQCFARATRARGATCEELSQALLGELPQCGRLAHSIGRRRGPRPSDPDGST
jgi:hypothetical protein